MRNSIAALAGAFALACVSSGPGGSVRPNAPAAQRVRPNVLFIAVDDLRPEGGTFGPSPVRTPSIDALARRGTAFTRAYAQQAVCSPSRTSLLTGRRPDTTRIYDLQTHFRATIPSVVTLPEHFKRHGYHTQSFGKVYHEGLDDPQSWSVPHWMPSVPWNEAYGKRQTIDDIRRQRESVQAQGRPLGPVALERDAATGVTLKLAVGGPVVRGPSWEDPDVADEALPDGELATKAIATLRVVRDRPFFLALGFAKPHLPFVAPRKYYDLYPADAIQLAANPRPPDGAPAMALHNSAELRQYPDIPKAGPLPEAQARALRRAYFASISYVDAQIGRVLAELDRLGLRDRTIVVLWGDHGFHLGEHGLWNKHTNFEVATRAPLIVSAPGKPADARSSALAELVDVYPTLCELAGLPRAEGLEGASLVPLLDDASRAVKTAAFSQYPRPKQIMGYSMRTDRYRYTEWRTASGDVVGVEIYDHETDPQESINLAGRADSSALRDRLSARLKAGWRTASRYDQKVSGTISSRRMADGKQWTTENLNVDAAPSYCYDDAEVNCRRYGRLYTWESAQRGCQALGDGWRLPTNDEWQQMTKRYGGVSSDSDDKGKAAYKALLTGGGSGFNAVLGGNRSEKGEYARLEAHGLYWTATESDPPSVWFYNFGKGGLALHRGRGGAKQMAISVRCVKE